MARRYHSIATRLIAQSQDAALGAVQAFNNPLITFKSETFIVLMNISWTYLLHAHYRRKGVEYRYFRRRGGRRRFERTDEGGYKYWDLRKCLAVGACPLDNPTKKNLLFLIGLGDEITHHMSSVIDQFASARYQACCLNYNRYIKQLFGARYGIDQFLSYSLQFQRLSREQLSTPMEADLLGNRVAKKHLRSLDRTDDHLPSVFPDIPDVRRMNRTVGDTVSLLERSEQHLAYMALPYVLSVYQVLAVEVIRLVRAAGVDSQKRDPTLISLDELHHYLSDQAGFVFESVDTALFDFVRQLRNRVIHFGGIAGSNVRPAYRALPARARELWQRWTGDDFDIEGADRPIRLSDKEIIAVLAVTKRLSKTVNHELERKLPRRFWAWILVADYYEQQPERFGQAAQRLRRLRHYSRHRYAPLSLESEDLAAAVEALLRWKEKVEGGALPIELPP